MYFVSSNLHGKIANLYTDAPQDSFIFIDVFSNYGEPSNGKKIPHFSFYILAIRLQTYTVTAAVNESVYFDIARIKTFLVHILPADNNRESNSLVSW